MGKRIKREETFSCAEAAKVMKRSTQTIRTWILLGKIAPEGCFQIGKRGRWYIHKSALEKARIYAKVW